MRASSEGTPEERLMAAIFGKKPWDPRFPLHYPYIVVEEDGKERMLGLAEAIQNALSTLRLSKGRNDPQEWDRYKQVLELRFGLKDGIPRTIERVGQETTMRVTREQVRQIEAKALRMLRHPARSRRLSEFFTPSPEEAARKNKRLQELREKFDQAEVRIGRLVAIFKGYRLREEDFEGVASEDIPQIAQALREVQEDREALQALMAKFPNNRVWNAIKHHAYRDDAQRIDRLSRLRAKVRSGEILRVRHIGTKAEAFFRQALQAAEQEAPS